MNKINGKSYVGFATRWPARKSAHLNRAFNPKSNDYNRYFHNALRLDGPDNFEWKILYESKDKEFCLKIMEPYMIRVHASHWTQNGYNITYGGDYNPMDCEHIKANHSNACIKRNNNPLYIEKYQQGMQKPERAKLIGDVTRGGRWIFNRETGQRKRLRQGQDLPEGFLYTTPTRKCNKRKNKIWKFISPSGKIYETTNLASFSRTHKLNLSHIYQVALGHVAHHRRWRCLGVTILPETS